MYLFFQNDKFVMVLRLCYKVFAMALLGKDFHCLKFVMLL